VAVTLSVTPILFYLAMWSGNALAMLLPAAVYVGWPVSPDTAASLLIRSYSMVGPFHFPLRLWLMALVAGVVVAQLLFVLLEPVVPWKFRLPNSLRRLVPAMEPRTSGT
jgi:hypothetical protein